MNYAGGPGDDLITGTDDVDIISGNGGDDHLIGGKGNDRLVGGDGGDLLEGGDGDDQLFAAGTVAGSLPSAPYANPAFSYYNPPPLDTGSEVDTLIGGAGRNFISAGYGDNVSGAEVLYISFLGAPSGVTFMTGTRTYSIGGGMLSFGEIGYLQGSNFDDTLTETNSANGNAPILGMGGNDRITGGFYTTALLGGDGNDVVDGRSGGRLQVLDGGAGDDILYGDNNYGSEVLTGGEGNDEIHTGYASAHGGIGNDLIIQDGSISPRVQYGDEGDDEFRVGPSGFASGFFVGGSGADTFTGSDSSDTIYSADVATIPNSTTVRPLDDMGVEHDVLNGLGSNDTLAAGYGDDVDGGTGTDTLRLSLGGAAAGMTLDTGALIAGTPLTVGGGTIRNVETLTYLRGTEFADGFLAVRQASAFTLYAGAGDDTVTSTALTAGGTQLFVGGAGADTLTGGAGNDTLVSGEYDFATLAVIDDVTGEHDVLAGGAGADTIAAGYGDDADGGADSDTLRLSLVAAAAGVMLSTGDLVGATPFVLGGGTIRNFETLAYLRTTGFADTVTVTARSVPLTLDTGAGDDTIRTMTGMVTVTAGEGDDLVISDVGSSVLDGGAGIDRVDYRNFAVGVSITLRDGDVAGTGPNGGLLYRFENLTGSAFNDVLTGNGGANMLSGGVGADTLNGGAGADMMVGGVGDDTYFVDNVGDVVIEVPGEGADTVRASLASYALPDNVETLFYTGTGAARLSGNAGDNSVIGSAGNDLIDLSQGGSDRAGGAGGDDGIFMARALDPTDVLDGGTGSNDQVGLQGNYTGANRVSLAAGNLVGIEVLAVLSGADTRFGGDGAARYGYDLTSVDANVAADTELNVYAAQLGAGESLTFDGSAETDGRFRFTGGLGTDVLTGGAGDDVFLFGPAGTFGAGDRLIGGGGTGDQLALQGDHAIRFGADQLTGVEVIAALSSTDPRYRHAPPTHYDLTLDDGNTAAGQTMTVDAAGLIVGETMRVDASAERDGRIVFLGGGGDDTAIGSAGDDTFTTGLGINRVQGGSGADRIALSAGADTLVYAAGESKGSGFDTVDGFDFAADRIDVVDVTGGYHRDGDVLLASLSAANLDTQLADGLVGRLGAHGALFVSGSEGDLAGATFLVVDQDGQAGYAVGVDLVIRMDYAALLPSEGVAFLV